MRDYGHPSRLALRGMGMPGFMVMIVTVPMVQVRVMGVGVRQFGMDVPVGMRFARRVVGAMGVLVVGIVRMAMGVLHGFMHMVMGMALGQVQP